MEKKLRIASFFAGVGGIDLGFEQTGAFETVYANEFDPSPAKIMSLNFPNIRIDLRDIREVKPDEIPDFDVMLGGFPCQAFSVAGLRQGFDDHKNRGNLFFELTRILDAKRPRFALFENVKNLVGHDNGNTFRVICNELCKLGYSITYQVLNACTYGDTPQNRERIYIIAFRDEEDFQKFRWPLPVILTKSVKDIIDFDCEKEEKYYYTPGKYKGDIYERLVEAMVDDDINSPAIYQWRRKYVRQNKSGVVPTLTANQGEGGHNVCIIKNKNGHIRKMTPRECFNAQGFPDDFKLPDDLSDGKLYKAAGNSVCVKVINRIADEIKNIL